MLENTVHHCNMARIALCVVFACASTVVATIFECGLSCDCSESGFTARCASLPNPNDYRLYTKRLTLETLKAENDFLIAKRVFEGLSEIHVIYSRRTRAFYGKMHCPTDLIVYPARLCRVKESKSASADVSNQIV